MIRTLDDLEPSGAAVGVRVDINSPLDGDGGLADDARIHAHLETLSELLERDARVAILAHQGRPGGSDFCDLAPHARRLDELLDGSVEHCDATFSGDARAAVDELAPGNAVLLENTRFYSEEYMEFAPEDAARTYLVERLAPVLDVFVNDAFAAAHRSQPSLVGFPAHLPSYAGRVMERELDVLGNVDETPTPRVYVLGGAKVEDSLDVARNVLDRGLADTVLTCGIVGNAFLLADGVRLGAASAAVVNKRSSDAVRRAGDLLEDFPDRVRMPTDVAVDADGERLEVAVSELPSEYPAMDLGAETIRGYCDAIESSGTVVLNGPAGVFEQEAFAEGTRRIYDAATRANHSIVGGGDTAAALRRLGLTGFSHLSTGGGACLNMLTGDPLPAVEVLKT